MKKVLIVILVILVFVLGSYFMYKEVWPRLDKRITVTEEFNVKKDEDEKEEKISVVDAHTYEYQECNVIETLPKIISEKENIKNLNEKMINDGRNISEVHCINKIPSDGKTIVKYDYLIKDNIIFIDIYPSEAIMGKSGGWNKQYIYDITSDKELTVLDAAKKFDKNYIDNKDYQECSYFKIDSVTNEITFEYLTYCV